MKYFLLLAALTFFAANTSFSADRTIDPKAKHPQYVITVTQTGKTLGKITVELYPELAPLTCKNFDSLVAAKAFDGTAFHRVISGFVIQGGDPNSKNKPRDTWGMGDPSQTRVPAEFSKVPHSRGMLSMARSQDPNSASSQFFICHADARSLDNKYTVFGKVLEGIEVVDKVTEVPLKGEHPIDKVEMTIVKK